MSDVVPFEGVSDPLGFLASDLVLCALPLRDPGDVFEWVRTSGPITWVVTADSWQAPDGTRHRLIPHGKIARGILLALCTEAVRTGSPRIELGESVEDLLRRLGIAKGGKSRRDVLRQLRAVLSMRISVEVSGSDRGGVSISRAAAAVSERSEIFFGSSDPDTPALLTSWVELSPALWESLQAHAMPIHTGKWAAISAASKSALPLDIYAWLSYRIPHVPNHGIKISWESILNQFGGTDSKARQARAVWVKALDVVRTVWPELSDKVEISREGITLRRGRSAISPKLLKGLPASPADEPSLFDDQEV